MAARIVHVVVGAFWGHVNRREVQSVGRNWYRQFVRQALYPAVCLAFTATVKSVHLCVCVCVCLRMHAKQSWVLTTFYMHRDTEEKKKNKKKKIKKKAKNKE